MKTKMLEETKFHQFDTMSYFKCLKNFATLIEMYAPFYF